MRWIAVLLIIGSLAGCVDTVETFYGFDADEHYRNPGVFPGVYQYADGGSSVQQPGFLTAGDPEVIRLKSDLPAWPTPGETDVSEATVYITMAVWRPANHSEPVPVIVDAGPYYEIGAHCVPSQANCQQIVNDTIDYPSQTTPFSLRNFLPHGYAVAQVAVRGTGTSGGCMDLLGPSEQHDLNQAIDHLASQPWSNGHVAMIGASYDGSTPWLVAASGNPHVKTIVPTASLPDIYDLMFHNGSSETRGAIMHNQVYWGFGFDDEFPHEEVPYGDLPVSRIGRANDREDYQDLQNLVCPEVYEGSALGAWATAGNGRGSASTYWPERDYRQRVLDNYNGSVFLIHGLQDWNVDPHAVIPFNAELRAAGIEMKEWYGQWGHAFPDSSCAQQSDPWAVQPCRLDFAEVLLRWYDHYLKGETRDLGPDLQVQDNLGFWRNAQSYPPVAPEMEVLHLAPDTLQPDAAAGTQVRLEPTAPTATGPGAVLRFVSEPLEEELRFSGMPQLKLPFSVEGQGGEIAAWLFDEDPRGLVRSYAAGCDRDGNCFPAGIPVIGHAQMNLRHYAGGDEPQPLVPNQRYVAQVEFEPLDVAIPAGNRIGLWIFQYHYPEHFSTFTPAPITVYLDDDAELRLPSIDVDPVTVFPVPGAHFLNHTYVPEMYVEPPVLPDTVPQPPVPPIPPAQTAAPRPTSVAACPTCEVLP